MDARVGLLKKNQLNIFEWLFFSLYMVMPTYCAIEFSQSLPMLTVGRIVEILALLWMLHKKKLRLSIKCVDVHICAFFVLIVIVDVLHFKDAFVHSMKDIFSIFFDQIILFILITNLIDTKEKFIKCLKLLLRISGVVAIVAIIGFCFDTNPFYALKTVSRDVLMTNNTTIGYRNGIMRIEAGFGHPIYYGMYCCVMAYIGLFFLVTEKCTMNIACLGLNIVALLLTNSRGDMLAFVITAVFALIFNRREDVKEYMRYLIIAFVLFATAFLLSSTIRRYVINIVLSLIVYFNGMHTDVLPNFGANMSAANDRLMQLTGVKWTIMNAPLIGFGADAHSRGLIYYYFNQWNQANSFDVGYVAIVAQYGLLGTVAYAILYFKILKVLFDRTVKNDSVFSMFRNIFVAYFLCMLSSVSIDRIFWVIISMFMVYCQLAKKELLQVEKYVL